MTSKAPFSVLLFALLFHAAARADVTQKALVTQTRVYTTPVLAHLSVGELVQAEDEFRQIEKGVRETLRRTSNDNIRYESVRQVGRFHTLEAQSLLFAVVRAELARIDDARMGADPKLLTETLRTLSDFGAFGPSRPSDPALEFDELVAEAGGRLQKHIYAEILLTELADAKATIDARREKLTDFAKLLSGRRGHGHFAAKDKLEFAREYLKDHVVGQNDAIDRILSQLWTSVIDHGGQERPNLFVLMGPKGFGHGTIARELARALNGYPTADEAHLFPLPVMKDHDDLWTSMGSAVGYYGSESGVPELVQWLVDHSGGRYDIQREKGERGGSRYRVVENADWSPGQVKSGSSPRDAVLFVKDFQAWSKTMKDQFLLPAITKGYFKLNNPNDGVEKLLVPVNIVIETTDGASLLTLREETGERVGKPLDHGQLHARWLDRRDDRVALESVFQEGNDPRRGGGGGPKSPGNGEDIVKTLVTARPMLLAPPSAKDLRRMVDHHLRAFARRLNGKSSGPLAGATLTWTRALARFVATYGVLAEDGALGLPERVDDLVRAPLFKLVETGEIPTGARKPEIELDLETNPDRTHSLVVTYRAVSGESAHLRSLMLPTTKDRPRPEMSDARIRELMTIAPRMKSKVFGIEAIADQLEDRALTIENSGTRPFPANVILMDGLSSTGKTQTAKEFAVELLGNVDELVTFDFSRIQTQSAFEEEISGTRDRDGRVVKSKLMKAYDRANGRLVIAFDELANVRDPNLLKILYDILREATVYTFADGKPRPMTQVTIIITGNATEGLYTRVPDHLPMEVQMRAFEKIAEEVRLNFAIQRGELGKTYPEAFMNRVQRGNTFLMTPHTWRTLRQLAQLKVGHALDHLRTTEGRRGWEIVFADASDYSALVSALVDEGFELREQGASIEKFVDQFFRVNLEGLLLRRLVPSHTKVVLRFAGPIEAKNPRETGSIGFDVFIDGVDEAQRIEVPLKSLKKPLEKDPHNLLKTAFHEAGHSLVTMVAQPKGFTPLSLAVIEGLTVINNEFVHFAGLWDSEQIVDISITREFVVREIATLLGGYVAERLVTRGGLHASGKANDIERVATLARNAIVRFGLSKRWGIDAVPRDQTIDQFVEGLPEGDKRLLRRETKRLVAEGERLARDILEANFDAVFLPLGLALAERGEMQGPEIVAFYDTHAARDPRHRGRLDRWRDRLKAIWRAVRNPSLGTLSPRIIEGIPWPARLADAREIATRRKQELYDSVPLPDDVPTGTNERFERERGPRLLPPPRHDCEAQLATAA